MIVLYALTQPQAKHTRRGSHRRLRCMKTHMKRESSVIALYVLGTNQQRRHTQNTHEEGVIGDCAVCTRNKPTAVLQAKHMRRGSHR